MKRPSNAAAGTALGYAVIAIGTLGTTVHVARFGLFQTFFYSNIAMLTTALNALTILVGIFGVVIGTKLESFEALINPVDADTLWASVIRRHFYPPTILTGCIIFACGGGVEIARIVLLPLSEIGLLVGACAVFAMVLGALTFNFGCALRRLKRLVPAHDDSGQ